MNIRSILMATTMVGGVALSGGATLVVPTSALAAGPGLGGCPTTTTRGGLTNPGCNLVITFKANGAITTSVPAGQTFTNYDGSDDALIGVVNDTAHTLTSFNINNGTSGLDILGFDGDGINEWLGQPCNAKDTTSGCYGGPIGYFTNIVDGGPGNPESATVNFIGRLAAGGFTYFSLEESISLNAPPVISHAPEPASLVLLGAGLAGLGLVRRRKA
jgi:hypothetical protein